VNDASFNPSGEADYAFTGRAEFLFGGNWKQFNDFTSPKGSDFGAMLGVAAHWQQGDNTSFALDVDRQTLAYTVDISLEGDSWNAFAAFVGRYEELRSGGSDTDVHDFGVVVQGGWRFAENTELFGRWDALFADDDRPGIDEDTFNFLTAGINQYYAGHAAKATIDVVYAFEETNPDLGFTGALPDTGVGLLGDSDEGELVVRLQFQVLF
jgi:hypothetical protein